MMQKAYRDSITEKDKVTNFVYQGGMLLHELDEDKNPARHYVLGNEQIEDDLTGLYYLRARYYNTGIGRFTQEDVIYNDGLNLYAYCSSNPVMYADPSGQRNSKSGRNAGLKEFDIVPYGKFKDYPGDGLTGHELLQNAWLEANGKISKMGVGISTKNPAIALSENPIHKFISGQQKSLGLNKKICNR